MSATRNTPAKRAVLENIQEAHGALSQAELHLRLKGLCDRVTVYRILDRLVTENKIHKIVDLNGVIKYAPCQHCETEKTHTHNHLHFSCIKCNALECIVDQDLQITLPPNYQISDMHLTISGTCPKCL